MKAIIPMVLLQTDVEKRIDYVTKEPSFFKLVFSNDHSWVRAKKLYFTCCILKITDECAVKRLADNQNDQKPNAFTFMQPSPSQTQPQPHYNSKSAGNTISLDMNASTSESKPALMISKESVTTNEELSIQDQINQILASQLLGELNQD